MDMDKRPEGEEDTGRKGKEGEREAGVPKEIHLTAFIVLMIAVLALLLGIMIGNILSPQLDVCVTNLNQCMNSCLVFQK